MCTYSMIADHYAKTLPIYFPWEVTRSEFDALKKEVENMNALLAKAKKYDEEHNEPDCQMEEKVAILKKIAELVGVELVL